MPRHELAHRRTEGRFRFPGQHEDVGVHVGKARSKRRFDSPSDPVVPLIGAIVGPEHLGGQGLDTKADAVEAGVQIIAVGCEMSQEKITINQLLPVIL